MDLNKKIGKKDANNENEHIWDTSCSVFLVLTEIDNDVIRTTGTDMEFT